MTVFSTINCAAVALLALSASGTRITFDMKSDGKYWWGGWWEHAPRDGNTDDCVCIKGNGNMPGRGRRLGVKCFKGIRNGPTVDVPFDFDGLPMSITTYGHDGLWVDRFIFETSSGRRTYGAHDTVGWCLSNQQDRFDKYAIHYGCHVNLSFGNSWDKHDRTVYSRSTPTGGQDIINREKQLCAELKGHRVGTAIMSWIEWDVPAHLRPRRRVDGSEGEGLEAPILPVDMVVTDDWTRELETVGGEYDDPEPTGDNPTQAHNHADAVVLERLHQEIRKLVRDNSDVTDAQIDQILNSAMLDVEHQLEREGHEGEVLEPEGNEGVIVSADVSVGTYTPPDALDGSTITNSKNDRVQGRLQDLEESP